MNSNEKYSVALPYPSLDKCIERNPSFAASINASRLGELQTISEYIYQSIVLDSDFPDIAKTLEGIAVVEMRHYKILSQLTYALGCDPYINNRIRTIPLDINKNGKDIFVKVKKALMQNIAEENAAKEEYRQLAKISHDPKLSNLLKRISDDEELHAEIFEKILHKLTF